MSQDLHTLRHWAVLDEHRVVLATFCCSAERADQRAARLEDVAGVRDITDVDPRPETGWRYERETKTWTPPTEEQQ